MWRLMYRSRRARKFVAIYFVATALSSFFIALVPLLIEKFVNGAKSGLDTTVALLPLLAIVVTIIQLGAAAFAQLTATRLGAEITNQVRLGIFRRILSRDIEDANSGSGGSGVAKILNEPGRLEQFFDTLAQGIIGNILALVFSLAALATTRLEALLLPAVAAPFMIWTAVKGAAASSHLLHQQLDTYSVVADRVSERLNWNALVMIRAHRLQSHSVVIVGTDLLQLARFNVGFMKSILVAMGITTGIASISSIIAYVLGAFALADGTMDVGALIAMVALVGRSLTPIGGLATALVQLKSMDVVAERSEMGLIDLSPSPSSVVPCKPRRPKYTEVEFRDVCFTYRKRPPASLGIHPNVVDRDDARPARVLVIPNLSFSSGMVCCLTGANGSGKSTAARLLLGLHQPTEGEIQLSAALTPSQWQAQGGTFGVILQEPIIFTGTVRENLDLGILELGDGQMWQELQRFGLASRLGGSERGLDLMLGSGATGLSGGERQRLAFARLSLHHPDVAILDEPTSQVDADSQELVAMLLHSLAESAVLLITHDERLLQVADKVVHLGASKSRQDAP